MSIHRTSVVEDSGKRLMARITDNTGTAYLQADVTSIAYSVYDVHDETSATATGTLTVATVIYDTLQTDTGWSEDSTGYNFGWSAPASIFATGGVCYRVEVNFNMATDEDVNLIYFVNVRRLARS